MGRIAGLDHVAFDVVDLERSTSFYREVFDAQVVLENPAVLARQLLLGGALLSLHELGSQLDPTLLAGRPTAGAADFCMTWEGEIVEAVELLGRHGWRSSPDRWVDETVRALRASPSTFAILTTTCWS